ncbi:hypothetical protein [Comamonas sp. JC664]|uniref:hypothetical protein n=1 Tax=Comamonas sp. JC664 TaxID=2801917 RepID=UPI00174A7394|nr:hypothetical protein [Comamonas sp. JC664]MBL0692300.1 hypothetical protein [Comamonas sp. JC664]GHG98418.1 hypothetical protein GCM10012319_64110 [Comamonas sp. KCTC 72670]
MRRRFECGILAGALALLPLGCGETPREPPPPLPRAPDAELLERIAAAAERVRSDTCFRERDDVSTCLWVASTHAPALDFAMTDSTGEAILIADDFRAVSPLMLRYRNRLQGVLRTTEDGTVATTQVSWHVPLRFHEVMTSFSGPDFIPAEWLRSLRIPISETYGAHLGSGATHGNFVFALLVEANPRQPIVLWDDHGFRDVPLGAFCDTATTPEALEPLREHARRKADSLRAYLDTYNVRFINYSRGTTVHTLRELWEQRCHAPAPADAVLLAKLETEAPVLEVLFGSPGVFAAHAAGYVSSPEESPFDFPSARFSNRLRIGFFTALESGLDPMGRGSHEGLQGQPASQAVDVYLNSGVEPVRPFAYGPTPLLHASDFGLDVLPITHTSTSWIAPLGLSRFIYLRERLYGGQPLTNERVAALMDAMVPAACEGQPEGRCRYQDPLRHGQTEAMRLGYRPVEYTVP